MARPRPIQPPRERILEAALSAFAARGVGATSIQEVAAEAGMSKQALLHHFRSKELLRAGVYELLALRFRQQLPAAAAELVSRSHDRYRVLLEVVLERPDAVLAWIRDEAAPWLGLIRGVVEQSRDVAPDLDAEAHVAVLGALMLTQSALVPRGDRRWHARMSAATLRVMRLGSYLP